MQFNPSIHNSWWRFWVSWVAFCQILYLLGHEARLRRLLAWANRKRLHGVADYYQDRLVATEIELITYRRRSGKLVVCCEFLHTAYRQIWPDKPPHSLRRQGRRRHH